LNGVLHNNFTFSGNIFEANNILIKEGNNTVNISGKNSAGVDSDQTIISFKKPAQNKPPKIVVSYPSNPRFNTNNKMILISGQIQNVENSNNVSVTMNGNTVKNFLFDTYFDDFQCELQLQNGINIFNIKAFNNDGKDESIVSIEYAAIECKNPIINLKSPNSNSVTASSSRGYISAVINNTQNVIFKIDGVASQGFNFNVNNGVFSSMINLSPGTHDYEINAFNTCGSSSEVISFTYGNLPNNGENNNEEKELNEETKEEQTGIKEEDNEGDEKEEDNEKEEDKEKSINEEKMLLELKQKKAILEAQRRKQQKEQQAAEAQRRKQQQEQQAAEAQRRKQQQEQQAAEAQRRKQQQEQQAAEAQRRKQQQEQQAAEAQRRKQQQEQQAAEDTMKKTNSKNNKLLKHKEENNSKNNKLLKHKEEQKKNNKLLRNNKLLKHKEEKNNKLLRNNKLLKHKEEKRKNKKNRHG